MLRVASYNIRKSVGTDWRRQPARILNVLSEIDADVIALQEVDRRFGTRTSSLAAEAVDKLTPYRVIRFGVRPQSLGWHGNALMVRKDIEVLNTSRISLPAFEPRGAVLADLRFKSHAVRIVGMHLGLLGLWRKRQARAVLDYLDALDDALPTVFMGDLNQWNTDGGCLEHFMRDHNVIAPGPSFHAHRPMLPLDRIITSHDFELCACGVHRTPLSRTGSDHLPVWAHLHLNPREAANEA